MSSLSNIPSESSTLRGSYAYTDLKAVHYGPGSLSTALPKLLSQFSAKKVLLVTGKSIFTKTSLVKKTEVLLTSHGISSSTFHEIGEHSPIAGINRGISLFKEIQADIIVSLGGGSPVDASKAMIYRLKEQGYREGVWIKQIAIPTTLSAAEYTIGAGYTDEEGKKVAVSSPELAPAAIILDAELTLDTPDRLWLSTGIRALDHAVENLYRPLIPPPLKVLCYTALADLFKYLPLSKSNPQDVAIRQKLQLASWMSLWPVKLEKYSALGISHALGHKLGARYGIPHGITSCLTLAPTVRMKASLATEEDKEWLAGALFHLRQPSTGSLDGDVVKLSELIQGLVDSLDLKSNLTTYNVPREDANSIAEQALGGKEDETQFGAVVQLLDGLF